MGSKHRNPSEQGQSAVALTLQRPPHSLRIQRASTRHPPCHHTTAASPSLPATRSLSRSILLCAEFGGFGSPCKGAKIQFLDDLLVATADELGLTS